MLMMIMLQFGGGSQQHQQRRAVCPGRCHEDQHHSDQHLHLGQQPGGACLYCKSLVCLLVGWLLNVPAICECISGTDLLRQLYVLPH